MSYVSLFLSSFLLSLLFLQHGLALYLHLSYSLVDMDNNQEQPPLESLFIFGLVYPSFLGWKW